MNQCWIWAALCAAIVIAGRGGGHAAGAPEGRQAPGTPPAVLARTELTLIAQTRTAGDPDADWEYRCRTPGEIELEPGEELSLERADPGLLADGTTVVFNPATTIGNAELARLVDDFAAVNLTRLDLSSTNVTDDGLVHLARLPWLQSILLSRTETTDASLALLAGLPRLRELRLTLCTGVTDAGLTHLAGATNLTGLDLGGTAVTDEGMLDLGSLANLRLLWLVGTGVTDTGLVDLAGLSDLTELGLSGAGWTSLPLGPHRRDGLRTGSVTDAGLVHLAGLSRLRVLWLGGTEVTDAGLDHLAGLAQLRRLWLAGTSVTAEGVASLQDRLPECTIRRRDNLPGYHAMLR